MDVSIIMPAYNTAEYIADALDSILTQEFKGSFEVLVSEDASTDNTLSILRDYADRFPEVVKLSVNDVNLGLSRNCESLITRAKGKYLAFCDSDDLWTERNKLQFQFDFLEQHETVGMICSPDELDLVGNEQESKEGGYLMDFNKLITGHSDIQNSSIMCRRELFLSMYEQSDWYLINNCFIDSYWAYWFALYSSIWCMSKPMSWYRVRSNSDCHSTDETKHYLLTKRYSLIKAYFLLTNRVNSDSSFSVFSSEYDWISSLYSWEGEKKVRSSRAYRLGNALIHPFKMVSSLFSK